jgi:hypothetical protein
MNHNPQPTGNAAMESEPTTDWNSEADKILTFLRNHQAVVALEEGVWVFRGTAESQLAGLLRDLDDRKKSKARRRR